MATSQSVPRNGRHWKPETDGDGIVWLHFDKVGASTNVLSGAVLEDLDDQLDKIGKAAPRALVIVSDKSNGFIAGADVNEFTTLTDHDAARALIARGQAVFDRLASLPFPTLSLIHGFCLGGGLELALACRYRIASDDPSTRLGLPEVKLGIHPGFGGTVRLPPLVGAAAAMDLMLSGRAIDARKAKRMGLIDQIVPQRQLIPAARELLLAAPEPHRPGRLAALGNHRFVRPLLARFLERQVAARAPRAHYPAPYALIDLWREYMDDPYQMLQHEADSVANLITGDTARNLVRVFLLQERLKGFGRTAKQAFQHVHVVGAGVMGGDIAAWCALRGLRVTLQDRAPEHIAPAIGRAHALFKQSLRDPRAARAAMDRLTPDPDGLGVPRADFIIEAIFENREAKQALYRDIEPRMRADAWLATNTSSIPLEELAGALQRPERLVGLHFFNPVAKMQLIEIVRGAQTDQTAVDAASAFARRIDRLPLPVKSSPGFLVNRVLMPYLLEAVVMESEGIAIGAIDRAAKNFGMPMGPIELADTVGLDICQHVAEILSAHLGGKIPDRLRTLVAAGRLGRKSGRGFYEYRKGKPVRQQASKQSVSEHEITDRLVLRLLNEAVACLREQVVEDADLADAGMVYATGFAPFTGGPLHYRDAQGNASMRKRLRELQDKYGERFTPDAGWGS